MIRRLVKAVWFLFNVEKIMGTLDDVIVRVNEMQGVVNSTVEFIDWLKAELEAADGNKEKIATILTAIDAQKQALGAAIANDPVIPPPPVDEPIPPVEEETVA